LPLFGFGINDVISIRCKALVAAVCPLDSGERNVEVARIDASIPLDNVLLGLVALLRTKDVIVNVNDAESGCFAP